MIQFKDINGQLCRMLEKPVPLTPEAKFPCAVRLIQDSSPIGKLNEYEIRRLGKKTIIAVEFSENGVVRADDRYFYEHYTRYEIIGYPVADGSAEWALWQVQQGKKVCKPTLAAEKATRLGSYEVEQFNTFWYIVGDAVVEGKSNYGTVSVSSWIAAASSTGWQLYEPKPAEPAFASVKEGDYVQHLDGRQLRVVEVKEPECLTSPHIKLRNRRFKCDNRNIYSIVDGSCIGDSDKIVKILSPSEVRVKVQLEGPVHSSINDCCFELSTPNGGWATIGFNEIDPATADLVRELIKKQGENNG